VMRHLAIGDIHGCIGALRALVDYISPCSDDTIVTLGDYVDRGPDSRAVLDFVIELGASCHHVPLRGNHEIMMLDARQKKSWLRPWLQYGGDATLRSYSPSPGETGSFDDVPDSHIDFLENKLASYHECDSHFFVHANADADVPLDKQSDATLYWRKYGDPERHCSDKIMVCGHSAQRSGLPLSNGHAICIDTWAHGGGWLSCLDAGTGMIWQTNEAGDKRRFSLDEIEDIAPARTDPQS
jgi:serine/threonine protein phosphatase 1